MPEVFGLHLSGPADPAPFAQQHPFAEQRRLHCQPIEPPLALCRVDAAQMRLFGEEIVLQTGALLRFTNSSQSIYCTYLLLIGYKMLTGHARHGHSAADVGSGHKPAGRADRALSVVGRNVWISWGRNSVRDEDVDGVVGLDGNAPEIRRRHRRAGSPIGGWG